MNKLLVLLLLSATPAMAQFTYPLQPNGGFAGGAVTGPILAPTGCVTPPYSFSASPTWGLCRSGPGVQVQSSDGSRTARFATSTVFGDPATAQLLATVTGGGTGFVTATPGQVDLTARNSAATITNTWRVNTSGVSAIFSGAINTTPALDFNDVGSNTFLSFTNIAAPGKVISLAQNSSSPSLTTTVTNGTLTSTVEQGYYYLNITGGNPATTQGTLSISTNAVLSGIDSGAGRTGSVIAEANGPYDDTLGSQPTCDVTVRGRRWRTEGGVGVADTYQVCTKDAANVYAWRSLI